MIQPPLSHVHSLGSLSAANWKVRTRGKRSVAIFSKPAGRNGSLKHKMSDSELLPTGKYSIGAWCLVRNGGMIHNYYSLIIPFDNSLLNTSKKTTKVISWGCNPFSPQEHPTTSKSICWNLPHFNGTTWGTGQHWGTNGPPNQWIIYGWFVDPVLKQKRTT